MPNDTVFSLPSEFDSPSEKIKTEWGLKYAQGIIALADFKERSDGLNDKHGAWMDSQKYARGEHDISELRRRAIPTETEWMALPFNIGTPAPKLIRILQENIYGHPYKPNVDIFDSHSHSRLEKKKNELLAKMSLGKLVNQLKGEGLLPDEMRFSKLDNAPKDEHEVEMYLKTNSKVIEQIAIEKLIRRSFSNAQMSQVERKIVENLVQISFVGVRTGIDSKGCFFVEHLTPQNSITSYCENEDFSDMVYAGHITTITVGELREKMPDLNDDELLNIVRSNAGRRLKQDYGLDFGTRRYFNLTTTERTRMEGIRLQVFNFETLQSDRTTYVEKELETGGFDIKKRSKDYKTEDPKRKIHKGIVERIYEGKFIMNTQYMMEWGLKPNVAYKVRKGKTVHKPCFSYIFYSPGMLEMQSKSIVEEIKPNIDKMLILEIKMLHFLALAKPPGFSFDHSAIVAAINGMGMEGVDPKTIIEMSMWTGDIHYASRDETGQPILQPGQLPITFNPSTVDQAIERFAQLWNYELDKVKEIMGMNDAVDSSTPDTRRLKSVNEQAMRAHKTAIRSLQNAYLSVVKQIAERCAYFQQLAIKNGTQTDEMRDLLSDPEFAVLNAKEIGELMFNISIELLPDDEEKNAILQDVSIGLQQGVIDMEDALIIRRVLDESVDKAIEVFSLRVQRRRQMLQEQAQQQQQMQMQAEQAKLQGEAQKEQMIMQLKGQLEELTKGLEGQSIVLKEEEARKTLVLKNDLDKELVEHSAKVNAMYNWDKETQSTAPRAAGRIEPSTPTPRI